MVAESVLNLESNIKAAYTQDHIDVVGKVTQELGQIYLQSEWRRRTSAPLAGYYHHPSEFGKLLKNSRLIRTMNHDFILYEIDYEKKRLVAHRANDSEFFDWSFNDRSLARQVFQERRSIHIADATRELDNIRETQLNPAGVLRFEITGPLFACPIRVGGQTEAVLVTWLKPISDPASERRPKTKTEQWFQS